MTSKRLEYKGLVLEVPEEVYEPSDDSFMLASEVCKVNARRVLDMGTGSGIQALTASKEAVDVVACDVNPEAVKCASKNAVRNGIENIKVIKSDLFSNVHGHFDLIIFNPPYLPSNPQDPEDDLRNAWDGGAEGRDVVDKFLAQFSDHLTDDGTLLLLQSSRNDLEKTVEIINDKGFSTTIVAEESFFFERLYVLKASSW